MVEPEKFGEVTKTQQLNDLGFIHVVGKNNEYIFHKTCEQMIVTVPTRVTAIDALVVAANLHVSQCPQKG